MKLLFATSAAALVLCGAFASPRVLAPASQEPKKGHDEPPTVLEDRMHEIEDALKGLRRSLRDPARTADSLALVAKLQLAAVAEKSEPPRMLPRVPEAERAKFTADYRKEMVHLLDLSLRLELALLDGNAEAATTAFDALRDLEDPAHSKFTEEEK